MDGIEIAAASAADAAELLVLTRACWVQEAVDNDTLDIPALHETIEQMRADIDRWDTYVVRRQSRLVASVRGRLAAGPDGERLWEIGRLMVAPDLQGAGLGRRLLDHIQQVAPRDVVGFTLFTGVGSVRNLRMYTAAGFALRPDLPSPPSTVTLTRERPTDAATR